MGDRIGTRDEHLVRLHEGTQTLDQVIEQRGLPSSCLMLPFEAEWRGERVMVRAVLELTAVVYPVHSAGDPDDRVQARRCELVVDAGRLRWREAEAAAQS